MIVSRHIDDIATRHNSFFVWPEFFFFLNVRKDFSSFVHPAAFGRRGNSMGPFSFMQIKIEWEGKADGIFFGCKATVRTQTVLSSHGGTPFRSSLRMFCDGPLLSDVSFLTEINVIYNLHSGVILSQHND